MSHSDTRSERAQWQRTLAAKCTDPRFIAANLLCLLSEMGDRALATRVAVALMRARATDRITIRYQPDGGRAVYAKAYYDGDLGCLAYRWLRYLWENDFGPTSREQVPEPLGYVARERMLVMRAASGFPASDFIFAGSLEQAKRVMRTCALWLAKFHRQPIPDPLVEPPCERMEILRTADLLAKVAAACPERTSELIDLVHQWKEVALTAGLPPQLATVHGQFRPEHVFVRREAVVAIDLDKLTLSDPAKDVARFVHSMMKTCMLSAGDVSRIAALGEEFMSAYEKCAPGNLANVRYYMSLYSLKELGKLWKNKKLGDADREAFGQMYVARFQKWAQAKSRSISAA